MGGFCRAARWPLPAVMGCSLCGPVDMDLVELVRDAGEVDAVLLVSERTRSASQVPTMSHLAPWEDTSGRGVRGPVYNTVENANWHRTCAYTPYTYTVAHAPSRADFTRDFTSADTPAAPRAPEEGAPATRCRFPSAVGDLHGPRAQRARTGSSSSCAWARSSGACASRRRRRGRAGRRSCPAPAGRGPGLEREARRAWSARTVGRLSPATTTPA